MRRLFNKIHPASVLCLSGLIMAHSEVIEMLLYQHYRTYVYCINFVYKKTIEEFGGWPLWQNYILGGISYIVNIPLPFSISRLLTLAGMPAFTALVLSEYFFIIAGTVCFFALMRHYNCTRGPALAGAALFQLFIYKWGFVEGYPMVLASAIVLVCEKYEKNPNFFLIVLGALSIAVTCYSGVIHGILFVLLFQLLFSAYCLINRIGKNYVIASAASWVLGLILSLPALWPQMVDAAVSQRMVYERYMPNLAHFPLEQFISVAIGAILLPTFFPVLLISLVLAAMAGFYIKDKKAIGLYGVSVLMMIVYIILSTTQDGWKNMPLVGKYIAAFDLNRAMCAIGFLIVFFAAYTINGLVNHLAMRPKRMTMAASALLIAIAASGLSHWGYPAVIVSAGVFLFILINLYSRRATRLNYVFAVAFAVFLTGYFLPSYLVRVYRVASANNLSTFKSFLSEPTLNSNFDLLPDEPSMAKEKILGVLRESSRVGHYRAMDIGMNKMNHEVRYLANQIYTLSGMANIYPVRYHTFFKWLIDDLKKTDPEWYASYSTWGGYVYGNGSKYTENLLSLAGVKWVIIPNGIDEKRFEKVITGEKYSLYRNSAAFPKVFPVFGLRIIADREDMERFMLRASLDDLKGAVPILASDSVGLPVKLSAGQGTAKLINYAPNEVLIQAEYDSSGMLVLNDNFHRIWKASVDGKPVTVYPAYYAFRMVFVPPGKHDVRFYLFDEVFYRANVIAVFILGAMIFMSVVMWENKMFFNRSQVK